MSNKLYAVYERVFVDYELVGVSQEMWTLEQIETHVNRMINSGWKCDKRHPCNNDYVLIFSI